MGVGKTISRQTKRIKDQMKPKLKEYIAARAELRERFEIETLRIAALPIWERIGEISPELIASNVEAYRLAKLETDAMASADARAESALLAQAARAIYGETISPEKSIKVTAELCGPWNIELCGPWVSDFNSPRFDFNSPRIVSEFRLRPMQSGKGGTNPNFDSSLFLGDREHIYGLEHINEIDAALERAAGRIASTIIRHKRGANISHLRFELSEEARGSLNSSLSRLYDASEESFWEAIFALAMLPLSPRPDELAEAIAEAKRAAANSLNRTCNSASLTAFHHWESRQQFEGETLGDAIDSALPAIAARRAAIGKRYRELRAAINAADSSGAFRGKGGWQLRNQCEKWIARVISFQSAQLNNRPFEFAEAQSFSNPQDRPGESVEHGPVVKSMLNRAFAKVRPIIAPEMCEGKRIGKADSGASETPRKLAIYRAEGRLASIKLTAEAGRELARAEVAAAKAAAAKAAAARPKKWFEV